MKADSKRGSWKRKFVGLIAVASIPVTAYAVIDTMGYFSGWVAVGSSGMSGTSPLLAVGTGNSFTWTPSPPSNVFIAGSYLMSYDDNSTVIGQWNADTGGDEAFVIGNGTGSGDKKNSLEVYKNGDVIIPNALEIHEDGTVIISQAQGDIDMGAFGN